MAEIFDRIRLTPAQLRTVADRRLADAECLRKSKENERANGAMYLGGFVLECLLKARLLEDHPWLQAPLTSASSVSEQRLWSLCYRSHDLLELLEALPALKAEVEEQGKRVGKDYLLKLMRRCNEWTVHARYSPYSATMGEAIRFLDDVKELRRCLLR